MKSIGHCPQQIEKCTAIRVVVKDRLASIAATRRMILETAVDRFERARRSFFREGVSSSRIYIWEGRESVGVILTEIITGLRSTCTYVGTRTCDEFYAKTVVSVQSSAGFREGKLRSEA